MEITLEIKAFHFAVISKRAPYDHAVVCLGEEFIQYGREKAESAFELFKKCKANDTWPGVFEMSGIGSQVIELPRWIK